MIHQWIADAVRSSGVTVLVFCTICAKMNDCKRCFYCKRCFLMSFKIGWGRGGEDGIAK